MVLKMPFVARPCVVRDPMNEFTIGRSFILLNQLYILLCKLTLIRQAAAPYLAASLSTLTLEAHIAAHISLVL